MSETVSNGVPGTRLDVPAALPQRRPRAWLALSVGLTIAVAVVDTATDEAALIGFAILGPLVASSVLSARQTALVAALALVVAVGLGLPNDIFGSLDHLVRVLVVAAGGAVAVWIARVRSARERAAVLLATQGEVAGILAQSRDLAEATPRLLEAIGTTLGWQYGGIWEPDGSGRIRCVDVWHAPGFELGGFERASREMAFEPGVGLPGRVWAACEARWIPDVALDPNFPRAAVASEAGLRAGFAFPIKSSAGCVGTIEFFASEPRALDADVLSLMNALGAQLGQYVERTRAQQTVRESEALKSAILESALDCVITMDHRGRVVEFNPAAETTFGYARDEAIGAEMAELIIPPSLRAAHRAGLARYLETGEGAVLNRRIELTGLRASGEEFPVELTITPITGGAEPLFTGYLRDITERKQAEEERERLTSELMQASMDLGRSRDQLQAILEGIADGVTAQDASGSLVYANDAAVRTLGFDSADELLAAPISAVLERFEILDERGRPFLPENLPGRRALLGEHPPDALVRFRVRETGEERWSIVKATPILDEAGRAVLAINIFEDITEHKRSEYVQRFLADTSRALVGSLDYETTLEQVAQLAVPDVADWCAVEVGEAGAVTHRVAVAHVDPAKVALAEDLRRRYPPDPRADVGVAHVLRTGESELYAEIPDAMLEAAARDDEHLALLRGVGLCSAMLVPMTAFGRTVGVITFASAESGRRFDETDLELAEEIGRRAAVAVENSRLYSERSYIARTLQESLLPPHLPDLPGVEIAARYQAAGEAYEVGGDFYDIFQTGGESWAAVIGDVRGKGPGAATVTALARYTLRAAAMRERIPSRILGQLNEAMVRHGSEDRFCTVAYAALEPGDRGIRLTVACGGHPMPFVLRRSGGLETVGTPGTLLGLVADPDLSDDVVELEPGDAVVLYTDGVSEARSERGIFGEERLVALLEACAGMDAARIVERIQHDVLEFQDEQPHDDVAVLVLRVREPDALRRRKEEEAEWPADAPSTAAA